MKNQSDKATQIWIQAAYGERRPGPIATDVCADACDAVSEAAKNLFDAIDKAVPGSREKTSAIMLIDAGVAQALAANQRFLRNGFLCSAGIVSDIDSAARLIRENFIVLPDDVKAATLKNLEARRTEATR